MNYISIEVFFVKKIGSGKIGADWVEDYGLMREWFVNYFF